MPHTVLSSARPAASNVQRAMLSTRPRTILLLMLAASYVWPQSTGRIVMLKGFGDYFGVDAAGQTKLIKPDGLGVNIVAVVERVEGDRIWIKANGAGDQARLGEQERRDRARQRRRVLHRANRPRSRRLGRVPSTRRGGTLTQPARRRDCRLQPGDRVASGRGISVCPARPLPTNREGLRWCRRRF